MLKTGKTKRYAFEVPVVHDSVRFEPDKMQLRLSIGNAPFCFCEQLFMILQLQLSVKFLFGQVRPICHILTKIIVGLIYLA